MIASSLVGAIHRQLRIELPELALQIADSLLVTLEAAGVRRLSGQVATIRVVASQRRAPARQNYGTGQAHTA